MPTARSRCTTATSTGGDWSNPHTVSTQGTTRLFAGEQQDPTTGLDYDRARWYNPSTGGFISQDPAQSDPNLYRYAGNDPTGEVDPSGMSGESGGGESGQGTGALPTPDGPTPDCSPDQGPSYTGSVPTGDSTAANESNAPTEEEVVEEEEGDTPSPPTGNPGVDAEKKAADKAEENLKGGLDRLGEAIKEAKEDGPRMPAKLNAADRAGLTDEYPLKMKPSDVGKITPTRVNNGQIQRVALNGNSQPFGHTSLDFVIRDDGQLVLGRGHCVLNQQGNTVRYAGKMVFDNSGKLSRLINDTGHYKTLLDNRTKDALLSYLKSQGVSTKYLQFVPYPP